MAIAAQDRYTLKLGNLAFADFRGYEDWEDVAVSQTEKQLKVIVANDVMMKAYRQGLPADGKTFPEGSKIVKIEWSFKKNPVSPYFVQVPDTLTAVDVIEKNSKRFRARTDGPTPISSMMPRLTLLRLRGLNLTAATRATRRRRQKITFSRHIRRGKWRNGPSGTDRSGGASGLRRIGGPKSPSHDKTAKRLGSGCGGSDASRHSSLPDRL